MTTRQNMTWRRSFVLALLLLAVLGGIAMSGPFSGKAGEADDAEGSLDRPLSVHVSPAIEVSRYLRTRDYTGIIRAARQSELGFKRADRLVTMRVDQGSHVRKGELLAQIDTRHLVAQRDQFVAQLEQAQAVLAELKSGPREETIAAQRATVKDLNAQAALLELQLNRRERLANNNAVSKEELDSAKFGLESIRARLRAEERKLDELENGTRQERIDAQLAVTKQLAASVRGIRIVLEESQLVAPFDGFVTKRFVDEGTLVSPGEPIFRMVEQTDVEAWIGLPPSAASTVSVETNSTIIVDDRSYPAKVKTVLKELDPTTRTQTVVFQLPSTDPEVVVPGQVARVALVQEIDTNGYWLPTDALVPANRGLWSVLVLEKGEGGREIARRRDVETIHTDGPRTLVRGTIQAGDEVISRGSHRIVVGQLVRGVRPSSS